MMSPRAGRGRSAVARLIVVSLLLSVGLLAQAPDWKHAAPGRSLVLTADHTSHPEYKLEWWYYTGNLDAADGRRFGYQLTFFRVGVNPAPANTSRWAIRDLFMTHLALTDPGGRRFLYTERLNRTAPAWAGADTGRYRVWNEDWEAALDGRAHHLRALGRPDASPDAPPFGIDLRLADDRPPALHGDRGYSQKGSDPGNASHYYSLPRMSTTGAITLDGRTTPVTGLSWMDHEFGTSFLEPEQIGWDWFAIQLQDGRSLMLYRFRRKDGTLDRRSSGTLVDAVGRVVNLPFDAVTLVPGRTWTSPGSGARYPTTWSVTLPRERIDLAVTAVLDAQELSTPRSAGVTYWEGAVDVKGTANGSAVSGRGYLEMTGYAGASLSDYLR